MGGVAALICAISFALLMLAAVVVVFKLARTMSITNHILNDLRKQANPLMGKLQTTIDHVNKEMEYVDGVLKNTERLAARANAATEAAQKLITSPLVRIMGLGLGVQRALGFTPSRKERMEAEAGED